jgi:hypothetical protein
MVKQTSVSGKRSECYLSRRALAAFGGQNGTYQLSTADYLLPSVDGVKKPEENLPQPLTPHVRH